MKRGIILMNLGSPDSTSVKDVRRYLNEFLMDERVIDMSYLGRLLLVRGIIVPFRAPKSAKAYASIWTDEGSPLIVLTKQLQAALQEQVAEPVAIAMRYGNPSPKQAYDELLRREPGLEEVILVPMYPHYAMSSYETAVEYAKEQHLKGGYTFKLDIVPPYYNEPHYLETLAESIRPFLEQEYDHILFSYHGVPERHIHKGDITGSHCLKVANCCEVNSPAHKQCYRHQCVFTTKKMAEYLQLPEGKWSFSFQSRLGRDPWLQPYTAVRFEEMPKEGIKKLLVVCPAFVSDCLETLEEIAEEGKEEFLHAGGETFTMIPCLNVHPMWVKTLVGYVNG
ncbi:ferrochelatase [Flavihumibacter stibioxidans]|uniref:Ferrochelatase n=1 Tax=Flavihumibacter stibioxidans TaxID=1834163 RepID=A0ABR7M9S4_9BACT|nr:ferrochelatase [Flavihumibacter stibioxidans]MBC6491579.1 ferrochelatase [Flavihumibacter stibioxidans]